MTISFQIHPSFRPAQRPRIDGANNRLYGIVAAMDVEATGHGICCDVKSLEQIAQLANAKSDGIPGRFGHPGMSENATGRKVQLAYNWRVCKGEKADDPHTYLVHDSQLMEAARTSPAFAQDPIAYIVQMAEQYPKQFAESLVIHADLVWTTQDGQELPTWEEVEDSEGDKYKRTRKRPANALTRVPVLRPTAVHFCDFVSEGALTHTGLYPMAPHRLDGGTLASLFTAENGANHLLEQLFATVDDLRQRFNIPLDALKPKVKRLLSLYLDARGAMDAPSPSTSSGDEPSTAPTPIYFSRKENMMSTRRQRHARARLQQRTRQELATATPADALSDDLNETEELGAETDAALDRSTAILNQAEQMAASMVHTGVALSDAPMLASAAQVNHLQEQLDQHTDQLHELTGQLKKLSEILVKNMEMTAALQRNIARANGETVVTQRVPVLGATGGLEAGTPWMQLQQPAPGVWAAAQQPTSTEERRAQLPTGLDPASPEARAIQANQRRAAQQRQA